MQKNKHNSLTANTVQDFIFHKNSVPDLQITGGCTIEKKFSGPTLSIFSVPKLCTVEKHERFIEFGPGVTLSQMIQVRKSNLPSVLYDALLTIATETIRNIATLGGNICYKKNCLTLFAPLYALDARLEFQTQNEVKYIPFSKFKSIPEKSVLTKIRVPLDEWEVAVFKRFGPSNVITPLSAGFVFLANTQKDIIANVKIVCAGKALFSSKEIENKIIGARLPLNERFISQIIEETLAYIDEQKTFEECEPIIKSQFLNMLRLSLEQLG
ncbi:MAG: FAD binding domain-containing protein [Treponema sp.]|nr:FAD binding domain-containing protein [Treponema sp.]